MSERAAWKFLQRTEDRRQTWSWRKLAADGSIDSTSPEFPSYAAAVMHAVQHGFRPKSQPYIVEWTGRLVRFAPGHRPITLSPEPRQARVGAKSHRDAAPAAHARQAAPG